MTLAPSTRPVAGGDQAARDRYRSQIEIVVRVHLEPAYAEMPIGRLVRAEQAAVAHLPVDEQPARIADRLVDRLRRTAPPADDTALGP